MNGNKVDLLSLSPYIRFVQQFNANDTNYYVPWRIIYDHEMIFCTEGECIVETESETYKISAGQVHIMKPFVRHKRHIGKGQIFNYYDVHFDFFYDRENADFSAHEVYELPCLSMVEQAIVDMNLIKRKSYELDELPPYSALKKTHYSYMVEQMSELLKIYESETPSKQVRLRAVMLNLIAEIVDEVYGDQTGADANSDIVQNYIEYITDNYQHDINLPKILKEQGISPSHFRRIFKSIIRKAPHEYLIDYRIEQSKKLLMTKRYTVSEVSYMVGYDDLHYFSRLFKNKEGVSPKTFIEMNS